MRCGSYPLRSKWLTDPIREMRVRYCRSLSSTEAYGSYPLVPRRSITVHTNLNNKRLTDPIKEMRVRYCRSPSSTEAYGSYPLVPRRSITVHTNLNNKNNPTPKTSRPLLSSNTPPPPTRRRRRHRRSSPEIVSGQFDEENPFVLISSALLVQPDEGVSDLVVDRIGDNLPQSTEKCRILVIPVGARHRCQQGNPLKNPMNVIEAQNFGKNHRPAAASRGGPSGAPQRARRHARWSRMVADQGQFVARPVAPQAAQPCANRCAVADAASCACRATMRDDAREAAAGREELCGDGAWWPTRLIAPPCCPSCALNARPSRPWLRRLLVSSCDDGAWSAAHVAAARAVFRRAKFLRRCSGAAPAMS
ncbi:hypothetical protein F511_23240 [Dorcoceras hygrometricum]|uniref:Uncharacterized protein n=1 Tax=Dorcoceras hygrometricum TaxID=472368 RepID=A0A2Z7AW02_9LAMI|nr:hypothetical protein F511_23240 [Dorcoceras hygrometricum]